MTRLATADTQRIARRLDRFVRAVCGDPVFRRTLRYRPQEALHAFDFAVHDVPQCLPVKHYLVDCNIDAAHLFGVPHGAGTWALPPEVRAVVYGLKPMALIHGAEDELTALVRWAAQHGLYALLSPFEFSATVDCGKGGYANRTTHVQPARAGSGRWRAVAIGPDADATMLAWLALLFGWDELLGSLLSYPACCCRSFARQWQRAAADHQGDVAAILLEQTDRNVLPAALNVFGRYFGYQLIDHFPCSWTCRASLQRAEITRRGLHQFEPEWAEELEKVLAWPVLYSETEGVFLLPGARIEQRGDGAQLCWQPHAVVGTDMETRLGRVISAGRPLPIAADGTLQAADVAPARLLRFAWQPSEKAA